jgi:hypothetical protein
VSGIKDLLKKDMDYAMGLWGTLISYIQYTEPLEIFYGNKERNYFCYGQMTKKLRTK